MIASAPLCGMQLKRSLKSEVARVLLARIAAAKCPCLAHLTRSGNSIRASLCRALVRIRIHCLWRSTGCAQPSANAFAHVLLVVVQELGVPRVVWSGTGEVCKATERDCMGNAVVAPFHHLAGEGSFRHHLVALLALDGGLALCVGVHGSASTHTEPHGTCGREWTSGCHAVRSPESLGRRRSAFPIITL